MRTITCVALMVLLYFCFASYPVALASPETDGPTGQYWTVDQANEILSKTLRIHLSPTTDHLAEGEKEALEFLLEVGSIMHQLYLDSRHPEASRSLEELTHATEEGLSEERVQLLRDLYWLSKGPIATTLDNKRVPFLPVAAEVKGKNVYPWGITKEEIDLFVTENPKPAKSIHHIRHIVRRNTQENVPRDLETLKRFPVLAELHPGLKERLHALRVESSALVTTRSGR